MQTHVAMLKGLAKRLLTGNAKVVGEGRALSQLHK